MVCQPWVDAGSMLVVTGRSSVCKKIADVEVGST